MKFKSPGGSTCSISLLAPVRFPSNPECQRTAVPSRFLESDLSHRQEDFWSFHGNFPRHLVFEIGSHQGGDADVDPNHVRVGPGVVGIESIHEAVAPPAAAFVVVPKAMQYFQTLIGQEG